MILTDEIKKPLIRRLLKYLNVFIRAYNLIIYRMTRSENVMENNNQIDLKFWKKNNISSLHSKRYLRRLSADIFMVELENSLLPDLTKYITFWKRNVDDTICFVKKVPLNL